MREDMKTGVYISGAGHVLVFLWIAIGGFFVAREPFEPVTITDVTIISEEDFQAAQPSSPQTAEAPPGLASPEADASASAPAVPEQPETPAPPPAAAPAPPAAPDTPPDPVEAPPPQPAPLPEVAEGDPGATEIVQDAPELAPEQAEVIADQVTEAPEPEVDTSDAAQSEVAPEASTEPIEEEVQEETAPEEATTQVVTEADETSNQAPTQSVRPGRKPTPPPTPAPQETEVAEPAPEAPAVPGLQDLIEDAVTEANTGNAVADNANPGGGTGQPITRAEKGAFILSIQRCWNVGALSTDALKVTVTVGFTMTPDAKPETGSIRLVNAEGGTGAAVDRAYEAARRAIIRCGAAGFGLPPEKYDQWRGVEVRFNATKREIR